jgi:glycine C-acetyltransferase
MTPIQAAIVLEALRLIESEEGSERRRRLATNVAHLRKRLVEAGFEVLGEPSAIIPTMLGSPALSRLATRFAIEAGGIVNLVEYPAVSKNQSRWRLQVMADHTPDHIEQFVEIARVAYRQSKLALSASRQDQF